MTDPSGGAWLQGGGQVVIGIGGGLLPLSVLLFILVIPRSWCTLLNSWSSRSFGLVAGQKAPRLLCAQHLLTAEASMCRCWPE